MYKHSFLQLKKYIESENFKGWDPFDGLNSKFFSVSPFKHSKLARLAWIQGFKRSPINMRKILLVPKEHNAKSIALFLIAYCNLYKISLTGNAVFGYPEDIKSKITYLADLLISLKSKGYSGACWGYNFDWQNRVFFQPKLTPTIVATSFGANALFDAFEITKEKKYLDEALSSADFVITDLNRFENKEGLVFSYSPLDNSKVYNASLLGARLLARCYKYSKDDGLITLSRSAINYVVKKQNIDGSWIYGEHKVQKWIDSFHTGYNLECIYDYQKYSKDESFSSVINKGMEFYLSNFILEDGTPKYYHNRIYPIDIHSPAQFIVTMIKTNSLVKNKELVEKVLSWTIKNMQTQDHFFIYQIKKHFNSKIPYMRWAQAWMFYAMSYYFRGNQDEYLD